MNLPEFDPSPVPNLPSSPWVQRLLDVSTEGLLLLEFQQLSSDWMVTYANASAVRLTGMPAAALVGESFKRLFPVSESDLARMPQGMELNAGNHQLTITPLDSAVLAVACKPLHPSLDHLLDQTDSFLRVYSTEGTCTYASPSVQRLLGYSAEELLGLKPESLIHPEDHRVIHSEHHINLQVEDLGEEFPFEYRILNRHGEVRWVSSRSRKVLRSAGGHDYHLTTSDITSRKQAELDAQERQDRYAALLNLTYHFETVTDPDDLATGALKAVLPLTEYRYGGYIKFVDQQAVLHWNTGAAGGPLEHELQGIAQRINKIRFLLMFRKLGPQLYQSGSTSALDHLLGNTELWASFGVLPIHGNGEVLGFLLLGAPVRMTASEATRKLLTVVSERVSLTFGRLVDLANLTRAREETLRAMGLVLEYRDFETKGHTERVTELAGRLGRRLKVSEQELDDLRLGAYLHDVGKVAISDMVLLKPGKLTDEERKHIQEHPQVGYHLLQGIPTLRPSVLDVVLYHQERWNGTGYPEGLSGKSIPHLARIFAVVDVYDALTSDRPYKKAFTWENACEILQKESGTFLDPEITGEFIRMITESQASSSRSSAD
ncbi:HD domain-containing phosphohydrolase [Deinococcus roseus]|uniref:Uncharacterized protein n=1 Tax=Deinococcus roseus TaxID=392414 RepID=A0ABQ2CVD3_9DEIO|nr:HD domain-containing phosphohydrolase [Deinococcus roseus]GGJ24704.1 hypothetical protein GCM10008938_08540 [Deinococcus roseus]